MTSAYGCVPQSDTSGGDRTNFVSSVCWRKVFSLKTLVTSVLTMDCDVEEVPSTESGLQTQRVHVVAQHCLRFRILHGSRLLKSLKMAAEPGNYLSGPTSLKIRVIRTQYVLNFSCSGQQLITDFRWSLSSTTTRACRYLKS